MYNIRVVVCAIVVGMLLTCVSSASAQFKASEASHEGSSYAAAMTLKAGGGTIECEATETKAVGSSIVENTAKEHVEKGTDLVVQYKKWDACVTEASGIETKEGNTTGGECEMEVKQPNEETRSVVNVNSTCTFKIVVSSGKICEVKVEPEGNKERKEALFSDSGEKNEDLLLTLAMGSVTTKISGEACKTAHIEASSKGELTGSVEQAQVAAMVINPLYTLSRVGNNAGLNVVGVRREVKVHYTGNSVANVMPGNNLKLEEILTRTGLAPTLVYIGTAASSLAECVAFGYSTTTRMCSMKVEATRLPTRRLGTVMATFKYENMNERSAVLLLVEY